MARRGQKRRQQQIPADEFKAIAKRALLDGTAKALGLATRVPELMRARGWPAEDQDVVAVFLLAVACRKLHAGGTRIRRPPGIEQCGGLWPAGIPTVTANHVVDTFDLDDLLQPR